MKRRLTIRVAVLLAIAAGGLVSVAIAAAQAQQRTEPKTVTIERLRDRLYLLKGGGGNSIAFVTDLGVVLVDTKLPGWGQPMLDKIKSVTNKPVTTLINTHAHRDHFGGNEFFPTSVEIVAHENARASMDKLDAFKGSKMNFLPKLMFKEKTTIGAGKDRVDLFYFGAAHTNGDAWVVFPALAVAHVGDMVEGKELPFIDAKSGGSGLAYPDSLARAAANITNVDTMISGHGPVESWKDLEAYIGFVREFRDTVVTSFHHGLSVSETAAAWERLEKDNQYGFDPDDLKADIEAIFGELAR